MKRLIQQWLGLDILEAHLIDIRENRLSDRKVLNEIQTNIRVTNSAIGVVVAKLSPLIGVPEDDPSRVSASKELGEAVIKKLKEEAQVLEHYGYAPKGND